LLALIDDRSTDEAYIGAILIAEFMRTVRDFDSAYLDRKKW
jgi:hypothetical protein